MIVDLFDLAAYLRLSGPEELDARARLIYRLAEGQLAEITGLTNTARAQAIGLEVMARAVRHVDGVVSSVTIDDYTRRFESGDLNQLGVFLTPAERAELAAIGGGAAVSSRRSVTLRAYR